MKATEANFLYFLQGPKQFVIPVYQRTYSWTLKQCQQLWADILRVTPNESLPGHFIGSIVYIARGIYTTTMIPQWMVIDGQQRLTTLSLLLVALGRAIEERKAEMEINRKKINSHFIFNDHEDGDLHYKLVLTQSDKETFTRLLKGRDLPSSVSNRILENYRYFEEQLRKSDLDLNMIYRGIGKLIIVDIALDHDHDNPQLIFESLNSTGLDLSQADLIRNYILMGLEQKEQTELYQNYWFPMEQSFGHTEYAIQFDRFMRDYLTLKSKSGTIPRINEVYADFKSHVHHSAGVGIKNIIADIYLYSKYFVKLAFLREEDNEIRRILGDINTLKVDVAYPFLLELYDDYERQKKLTRTEFIAILNLVESYVFRRAICGIPTNSLNKTFATLSRTINKENYLESVQAAFLLKDSYMRLPRDEEFKQEFIVKDVYNFRSRNYLLRKMENHERKETVDIESYTIEHILPQNEALSPTWQQELGQNWQEIQAKYLHTTGNLTLTGYNSELSDRPFKEKRDMDGGFKDSPIRLNRSLAKLEQWNEAEIQQRAKTLADLAIGIWPAPELPVLILDKYRQPKTEDGTQDYTFEHFADRLQGDMLELYHLLRKRILNLDSSVRGEFKKLYIAYKTTTNFVDIVPQKSRLRLSLNMSFDEINDPQGLCKDVSGVGRWGNGDVEVGLSALDQIDYIMFLIRQSFEKHREDLNE